MKQIIQIIFLSFILSSCAEKNQNIWSKKEIQEVYDANKAMVILQTTPLVINPEGFFKDEKKIDIEWLDISSPEEMSLNTKNYRFIYLNPLSAALSVSEDAVPTYQNIEVYITEPGEYSLHKLKYSNLNVTKTYIPNNIIARFTAKKGEVIYIGNLIVNLKDQLSPKRFFKELKVEDNYSVAKSYLEKHYPALAPKLQTNLIVLSK